MRWFFELGCLFVVLAFVAAANAESKNGSPACAIPEETNALLPPYANIQLRVDDLSAIQQGIDKLVAEKRIPFPERPFENTYYFSVEPEGLDGFLAQVKTIGEVENVDQHRAPPPTITSSRWSCSPVTNPADIIKVVLERLPLGID